MTTEEDRPPLSSEVKRLEGEVGPHAHHPLLKFRIFEQLKQRNVFRVAVLYVVVCWLILDPVHVLFHMLDVPIWANRLVVVLMAIGFPAVVIFAWVYEITPEGLRPTVEVSHEQSIRKLTGRRLDRAIIAVLAVALAYFVVDKFWIFKDLSTKEPEASVAARPGPRTTAAPAGAFSPPPHSIAVLPFINLSGDQEQEYFSDGLTEELLNSLAEINGLQVAARTSAFSFKGKDNDIGSIARKLNVAAVLEGSVRRSARTVRVTAQLINAVTGFHLWSKTYDRDVGDVLKLQTEIATAVASALKVTLLGGEAGRIELGGTHNPAAFDAYLRASKAYNTGDFGSSTESAIAGYTEAIHVDPNYALAFASRSIALNSYVGERGINPATRKVIDNALADARKAISLAPDLAEAHLALAMLATFYRWTGDLSHAKEEYERAMALAPGNATVLGAYGRFAVLIGRAEAGIASARRAVVLDPLNPVSRDRLGQALYFARRYKEAVEVFGEAISVEPEYTSAYAFRGLAYYGLGDFQSARSSCESRSGRSDWVSQWCLSVVYEKLGRHAAAQAELTKWQARFADAGAYQDSTIYAQWGNTDKALEWLATAMRVPDQGLTFLKTDPLMDPLRKEPRFQAIERALKFPN